MKKGKKKKAASPGVFRRMPSAEVDLTTDIRASILAQSPRGGRVILWLVILLFSAALVWAYYAEIDEVTRGVGKVVPSQQIQIVQNLEGGILSEILVKAGEVVEANQLLLRIDETRFSAPLQDSRLQYLMTRAKLARLEAESHHKPFVIPPEVMAEKPAVAIREQELFDSRKEEFEETLAVLNEQIKQRTQEVAEVKAKTKELSRTYGLLSREIAITLPLVKQGVVSEVEALRLKRQRSEMRGEIESNKLVLPKVESMLQEALRKIKEVKLAYSNLAKIELNDTYAKLEGLSSNAVTLEDRLKRTAVRSPVHGIVKQILINTVGGVIQPGMDLVQIVPLEDTLLVEARINPADIAFIGASQKVTVKLTAYDYTMYGGLEGKVENISADSITDDQGNSFYLVNVRTNRNHLETKDGSLPIIPGMVASVDILTGKKSILTYLLKPILRAQNLALRER